MGMWSKKWRQAQEEIYLRQRSRKSASKWTVSLIKRIWKVPWAMWLHWNKVVHLIKGTTRADTEVETEIRHLFSMGAPARMERRFREHWSETLSNILSWEQRRKLAWIKTANKIRLAAQAQDDEEGITQMANTMQGWLIST